jgi:hypothetical protein
VDVTSTVCEARYKRSCAVDADCGPAGFTCMGGSCRRGQTDVACTTAADCPAEWECYAACGCTDQAPKSCQPPFITFHCPLCPPVAP